MTKAIEVIDEVIKNGEITSDKEEPRVEIDKENYRVVIARDEDGRWVLMAIARYAYERMVCRGAHQHREAVQDSIITVAFAFQGF